LRSTGWIRFGIRRREALIEATTPVDDGEFDPSGYDPFGVLRKE